MTSDNGVPLPVSRRLRIFSFDPGLASQYDWAIISEISVKVRWEKLERGPIGEYIEVIDVDPASGVLYQPINLDSPELLARDGLAPSESNPQFHQQMVYAVAMTTIDHFERALGRVALWSPYRADDADSYEESFVRRLRIYPHALRERNAYYSPDKKALLFGYFPVEIKDEYNTPGTLVFTCLSHDIIAHETTHALLDGVHPRFNKPMNQDVLAFHEAFADIVALFQHFSYPGVLREQIARTRGSFASENMLGQLAQQFGRAAGKRGALRDALGKINEKTGKWEPRRPDPGILESTGEAHERGAVLVAAVFGAFTKVYRSRTTDLYRIATGGTGTLPEGDIHPDLAKRLADEAAQVARYLLTMCIRAIDYCPPVGITFGDYLRAIVTADFDINPEDENGFRLAVVESFRQWGINPRDVRSMSAKGLMWPTGEDALQEASIILDRTYVASLMTEDQQTSGVEQEMPQKTRSPARATKLKPWNLESERYATWLGNDDNAVVLWAWLVKGKGRSYAKAAGIIIDDSDLPKGVKTMPKTVFRSKSAPSQVAVEVHSVRTALRRTARGATTTDLVVEITQRRRGYFDQDEQRRKDENGPDSVGADGKEDRGDFRYRAGCTLLIDPVNMDVKRVIRTPGTIVDDDELERQRSFLVDGGLTPGNAYALATGALKPPEPFALLHGEGG